MVEHLSHKQNDPVRIRRRPAYQATIKNTSFHSRGAILPLVNVKRMDYVEFLQKPDEILKLPYFGGKSVCDDKLTYRLRETLQPGWYQFRRSGRYLTVDGAIEPELEAWKLQRVSGYVMSGRIIGNDFQARLFGLPA